MSLLEQTDPIDIHHWLDRYDAGLDRYGRAELVAWLHGLVDRVEEAPRDWFEDVLEFHRKLAPSRIGTVPGWADGATDELTTDLVVEEFDEFLESDGLRLVDHADACIDLIYVTLGRLVALGIDPRPLWDAVHAANMAKEGGETRADGKVLKPAGWVHPDIAGMLERQKPLGGVP